MKVKRVDGGYSITHNGQTHMCTKAGRKWLMSNREFATKEDAKAWLTTEEEQVVEKPKKGLWDCVNPCVWLVLEHPNPEGNPAIMETLDCYGWLKEDGTVDRDMAIRQKEAKLGKAN